MFAGGSYEEVGRWLLGFVNSHVKHESPRVEGIVESGDERAAKSFGVRLRVGERFHPPLDQPAIEYSFAEVSAGKGSFAWCHDQALRARGWARQLLEAERAVPVSRAD